MNVAELTGMALDYWVARGLPDFVREIYFTDSGATVAVRGNDRGRAWDGRFTPSSTWEAAAVVLERAEHFELLPRNGATAASCVVELGGAKGAGEAEGRGDNVRLALLRAFVASRFGDTVGDVLRQPQALMDGSVAPIAEPSAVGDVEDMPRPDAQIGDIGSAPR